MNRHKKELLEKYTPEQIRQMDADSKQQQWDDAAKYPELFSFMYDSTMDMKDREKGISPMTKEFRDHMRKRYKNGEYPERLHHLVLAELNLKHPDESE